MRLFVNVQARARDSAKITPRVDRFEGENDLALQRRDVGGYNRNSGIPAVRVP